MPIYLKHWGIKKYSIPYMVQIGLTYISIKCVVVNPYVDGFLNKDPMENKSGAIYWFQSGELACDEEYIGETSRTFGKRFKEHLMELSPIHNHSSTTGQITIQDTFQIIWGRTMALPEQLRNPST